MWHFFSFLYCTFSISSLIQAVNSLKLLLQQIEELLHGRALSLTQKFEVSAIPGLYNCAVKCMRFLWYHHSAILILRNHQHQIASLCLIATPNVCTDILWTKFRTTSCQLQCKVVHLKDQFWYQLCWIEQTICLISCISGKESKNQF